MRIFFWLNKGKGILVILYLMVSFFVTSLVVAWLSRSFGGVFSKIDLYTTFGIALLFAAAWTYLTKDDHYEDRNGNKKKMDTINSFFFLEMRIWAIIFFCAAFIFFGNGIFQYFKPVEF